MSTRRHAWLFWACLLGACLHLAVPTPGIAAEPPAWHWRPTRLPQALLVEGLWTDTLRLRPATHLAGLPYQAAYRSASAYWNPSQRLLGTAITRESLASVSVVVLSNIDAPVLGAERLAALRDFVRAGGGLVVLGGHWAFGRGSYLGTPLAELLPVTFTAERFIPAHYAGLPLAPAPAATWDLGGHDFGPQPRAFFVQALTPKPEATVQVRAGELPAIVSGSFGQGRVVAIALTAHGEAPAGALAYWDWPGWPALLAQSLTWATAGRPPGTVAAKPASTAPVVDLLDLELSGQALTPAQVAAMARQPTPETALLLLQLAANPTGKTPVKLAEHEATLRPLAKPAWGELLKPLADTLNADRAERRAALRLLGASRATSAYPILSAALDDEPVMEAAIAGLGLLGDERARGRLRLLCQQAWAAAQSAEFPGELNADAFGLPHGPRVLAAAQALYYLGEPNGLRELLRTYGQVQLYQRIFANAAKRRVRDTDATGILILQALQDRARALTLALAQSDSLLGPLPASQLAATLTTAQTLEDPVAVLFLWRLLERSASAYPPATWQPLTQARDGILAHAGRVLSAGP